MLKKKTWPYDVGRNLLKAALQEGGRSQMAVESEGGSANQRRRLGRSCCGIGCESVLKEVKKVRGKLSDDTD